MKKYTDIVMGGFKMRKIINVMDGMELALVPEQTYIMGSRSNIGHPLDKEGPPVKIETSNFYMSTTTVTNKEFQKFVNETGYKTEAEKIGRSFVFRGLLETYPQTENKNTIENLPWWVDVEGANWKNPEGPGSTIIDRLDHPVVHVTWNDANVYCDWVKGRLPTEAEWEVAARAGVTDFEFPWGNSLMADGEYMANTWQGNFPFKNTAEDGYIGTAPAKKFYMNSYGIHQMIGNVWEWCLNPAKISLEDFNKKALTDFIIENEGYQIKDYSIRGGSFLCHSSYCNRYRLAARNGTSANSSSSNTGFRYVKEY